jgi:16S rRNA (cytosine967-C5)-methyltransferase
MEFDCILLDVPCSNTGVLAKRIEMRFRLEPDSIKQFAKTQRELLEKASMMIKPYGTICYSTCSIQKDENNAVIQNFLAGHANFNLVSEQLVLPSASKFDHDGGYAAVLSRKS